MRKNMHIKLIKNRRVTRFYDKKNTCLKEQGSVVLEGAIVFPFIIFIVFFMIYVVKMTMLCTALQTVASEAVKQIAAKSVAVSLVSQSQTSYEHTLKRQAQRLPKQRSQKNANMLLPTFYNDLFAKIEKKNCNNTVVEKLSHMFLIV